MTVRVRVSSRLGAATVRCSYCFDALDRAAATECAACRTRLHADCLAAAGACTTLGCAAASTPAAGGLPALDLAERQALLRWHPPGFDPADLGRPTPPPRPLLGGGWPRALLARLLGLAVGALTLVAVTLVGAAAGAGLGWPTLGILAFLLACFAADAAGGAAERWLRGEHARRRA